MIFERMRLDGRKGLVIGAGTAAGRAIAVALAEAGADVAVASATTDGEEVMAARRARRAVEALGRRSTEYAFDTTLGQNVQVSTRQVSKEMGGLDLLVNAQEFFFSRPAEKTSDAEWTRTIALNLSAVFYACRSAVREMPDQRGRIINVIAGLDPSRLASAAAYVAARHGVVGLTRALAVEYAERGICVNAIEIGLSQGAAGNAPANAVVTAREGGVEAIGPLALYLASDAADGVSGQLFSLV